MTSEDIKHQLIIIIGRFPAVSAWAARCDTQLTYTNTSLHPHKHLFAARKSLLFFVIFFLVILLFFFFYFYFL